MKQASEHRQYRDICEFLSAISGKKKAQKIAILVATYSSFDGVARVVEQQSKELVKNGYEVTIFTLESDMSLLKSGELEVLKNPRNLYFRAIYRILFPLDILKTIKCVLRFKVFDVVIAHHYPMTYLAYFAKNFYKDILYIFWNHGQPRSELHHRRLLSLLQKIVDFLEVLTVKNANYVVSVSKFSRDELNERVGLDSIVIYNKIDIEKFGKDSDGRAVRNKYGIGNDPLILFVGRVVPHKAIHLLIEAFKLVRKEISNANLIVVGRHSYDDYSKRLVNMGDESVIFAGYVPDEELPYYYAACDVYATCSLWENFNLPVVEAQACGKPVVAFSVCSHPEVVINKKTGLLVPPRDIRAFADAIIKILSNKNLAREMSENARRFVKERFG